MRISDCSSDVCSSDLHADTRALGVPVTLIAPVPLDDSHLLDEFTSRAPSLDDWLRRRARANQDSGASRTFVLCDDARIIAYYSLASSSIACAEAVGRFRLNMPHPDRKSTRLNSSH